MHRPALRPASLCSLLVSVTLALSAAAQGRGRAKQRPVAPPASTAVTVTVGADSLNNVKFRNLGPSVGGGRVAAVVGVPGDRNTYYVGAAAGGVWKTTDGGPDVIRDRKSTRLNSSHLGISYAVFCLKKKKRRTTTEWFPALLSQTTNLPQMKSERRK